MLPKTTSTLALCIALAISNGANAKKIEGLSIEATTLDNALLLLAEKSEIQILFSDEKIKRTSVSGISGDMSVEDALSQLLKDSDYIYKKTSDSTFIVYRKTTRLTPQRRNKVAMGHQTSPSTKKPVLRESK